MNMDILEELEPSSEVDLDLEEPQFRERSNTWPLRPTREELESQMIQTHGGSPLAPGSSEEATTNGVGMVMVVRGNTVVRAEQGGVVAAGGDPLGFPAVTKKSGARRNAWGPASYADLITTAIQGSQEKRLTLSQIYDWMVQNVPYFKDKGDSTSAAGWKNSIRHNLSLHNRFMRIQNEGTGKSSWWVINPDAKPGKPPRRRAGSMDTKSGEKKRGRINKKKQEAIRAALENCSSPLNGSVDFLDTLAFGDFRSRASSNASSCSRRSPVPIEGHDNQVPPMSPIPWGGEVDVLSTGFQSGEHFRELASSLADSMNLSSQDSMDVSLSSNLSNNLSSNLNSDVYLSSGGRANTPETFKSLTELLKERNTPAPLRAPPPYPERISPAPTTPQLQSAPLTRQEQLAKLRQTLKNKFRECMIASSREKVSIMNQVNNSQAQLSVSTQQQTAVGTTAGEGSQQGSPNNPHILASLLSPASQGPTSPQEQLSPMTCQLPPQQQQQQQQQALLGSPDQQANLSPKVQQQQQQQQQALLGSPDQQANLSPKVQQQQQQQQQQALLGSPDQQANLSPKVQQQQQQQNTLQQQQENKSILRSALTHGSLIFNQPSSNNSLRFILGMTQSSPTTATTNSGNINTNIVNLGGLSPGQHQIQQQQQPQQQQQQQQQQQPPPAPQQMPLSSSTNSFLSQLTDSSSLTTGPVVNNVLMQSNGNALNNGNNNLPMDMQVETGNFMNMTDYEMEQVIRQELSLEGNLDATFDNIMPV